MAAYRTALDAALDEYAGGDPGRVDPRLLRELHFEYAVCLGGYLKRASVEIEFQSDAAAVVAVGGERSRVQV